MKYPLSTPQRISREIICWFIGHRWKSSSRLVRSIDTDVSALSYVTRQGNPYWENSKMWHYKCKRCREQCYDDFQSFHIRIFQALRAIYSTTQFHIKYANEDEYQLKSKIPYYFWNTLAWFCDCWTQAALYIFPHSTLWDLFADGQYQCYVKMDQYIIHEETPNDSQN